MCKKIILIMALFLLMMNLLIGVIYEVKGTDENIETALEAVVDPKYEEEKYLEQDSINNTINDNRLYYILVPLILFFILLILIEKISTIRIILRLLFSFLILYYIYVKGFLNGNNKIILAIITVFLISFLNIFIKEGIHKKSFIELLSVVITSLITGLIILVVCFITKVQLNNVLDSQNIIFGIASIALIGIYLDIVSKMVLKLDEEKNKKEDIVLKKQFKIGINIGKELVGDKINLIFLICVGNILFPLCMYISSGYSFIEIIKFNDIFLIFIIAIIRKYRINFFYYNYFYYICYIK